MILVGAMWISCRHPQLCHIEIAEFLRLFILKHVCPIFKMAASTAKGLIIIPKNLSPTVTEKRQMSKKNSNSRCSDSRITSWHKMQKNNCTGFSPDCFKCIQGRCQINRVFINFCSASHYNSLPFPLDNFISFKENENRDFQENAIKTRKTLQFSSIILMDRL